MNTLTLIQTIQLPNDEGRSLPSICAPVCGPVWAGGTVDRRAFDYQDEGQRFGTRTGTNPYLGGLGGFGNMAGNKISNKPSDHAPEVTP